MKYTFIFNEISKEKNNPIAQLEELWGNNTTNTGTKIVLADGFKPPFTIGEIVVLDR